MSHTIFFAAFSLPLGRVPVKAGHSGVGSIAALIPYLSSNPPPADGVGFFTILSHVRRWLKLKTIEFLSRQLSSSPLEGVGGYSPWGRAGVGSVTIKNPTCPEIYSVRLGFNFYNNCLQALRQLADWGPLVGCSFMLFLHYPVHSEFCA